MTVAAMAAMVGQQGQWSVERVSVPVTVVDVRENFGRVDLLIEPVGGAGQRWTDLEKVELVRGKGTRPAGSSGQ